MIVLYKMEEKKNAQEEDVVFTKVEQHGAILSCWLSVIIPIFSSEILNIKS